MPLNRSQFLQGNTGEGPVLAGKVQGIKEGPGIAIASDGSASVDADTAVGLVKTNNLAAFNEYVWPNTDGEGRAFLSTDGAGNLIWGYASGSSTVFVGSVPPENALIGQLWYDTNKRQTFIFENADGDNKWTNSDRGADALAVNVSAAPAFTEGSGGSGDEGEEQPFNVESEVCRPGQVMHFATVITITGLAPYQYVPIIDTNAETNGYRFGVSNSHADSEGVLSFRPTFFDFPVSPTATAHSALYEVGFSGLYIKAAIGVTAPLSIINAGTITGTPEVNQDLSYTEGLATGGTPPYAYTWQWRRASDSEVMQTGGDSFKIPPSMVDDQGYVELTATDARNEVASLSTAFYPASPGSINRGPFPLTDILYPEFSNTVANTVWQDPGMTIFASGCVEFTTDGINWGQGGRVITNGGTVTTRWLPTDDCLGRPNGTLITGCIYSDSYEDCGSLMIDKLPSPFSIPPVNDVAPLSVVTSASFTPIGYNSECYVTYSGNSNATSIEGSLDGGATWTPIPLKGTDTFAISPGDTLTVKATAGADTLTAYDAVINIGKGNVVQSAAFVLTTAAPTIFVTEIPFPVTTYQGYDAEPAPSVTWAGGDGAMSIEADPATCIEFRVNGGSWTQSSTAITTGNTLETRWKSTAGCGLATHGTTLIGTITDGATRTISGSIKLNRVPADFSFVSLTGQDVSTQVTSGTIPISGFNARAFVSYTDVSTTALTPEVSVNSSGWVSIPTLGGTGVVVEPAVPGNTPRTLQVRVATGASAATNYNLALNVGNTTTALASTNWVARTSELIKTVVQPSVTSPINGATNLNPNSIYPAGISLASSSYLALNGAGTHASSSWEIRKGSTGGTTIVAVSNDVDNLTSYFLPLASLDVSSTYYARVQHHSLDGVDSLWSSWTQFRTSDNFSLSWVKRYSSSAHSGKVPQILRWHSNVPDPSSPGGTTGIFVGVGDWGRIATSRDGKLWEVKTINPSSQHLYAVGFDGTKLFVGGDSGKIYSSSNAGVSWSMISTVGATTARMRGMAYGAGVMVSVHDSGVIQTSTNGCVTWTNRSSGVNDSLNDIIFVDGMFYAIGGDKILTSNNGVTWSVVNVGSSADGKKLFKIAHLNGKFVIARDESLYMETSSDGSSWTSITAPYRMQYVWGGGIWFVGSGSYSNDKVQLWSSVNGGVNWNKDYDDNSEIHIHGIAYAPELGRWAALAHNFTAYSTT
ncbi:BNR repeat domain protein [Synechococcus phage S-CBWM1]|uniref:BNR repeat domain protein n=1 Tax=Synechococcus phage S-CBWM1 TaxID=2053653 RepID=A0A3G1L3P5_9CAUD|nr:BNR repeat domain protein [Synechococcus phage S-CBWM1]ATW62803.1 BNR repeat domain protein [Synechococcus phage S-CBWM1]